MSSRRNRGVFLIIYALIILIAVTVAIVIISSIQKNKSANQFTSTQTDYQNVSSRKAPQTPVIKEYSFTQPINYVPFVSNYGYKLEHPEEWGEANESIIDNDAGSSGYTGKSYYLRFSLFGELVKNFSFAVGHSSDYSAARGTKTSDYNGDPDKGEFVDGWILLNWETIDGEVSGERTYQPYPEYGIIDFNLPGREISGVRLYSRMLSEEGRKIFFEKYEQMNYPKPSNDCLDFGGCDEENQNLEDVLNLLRSEGALDDKSEVYVSIYEHLLKTSGISK